MNIFDALRRSHDKQRGLSEQLVNAGGDSTQRQALFDQLKTELMAHAAAEERCFYVPLIAHDLTQEPSRHGIAEHHDIDKLIEKAEEAGPGSSAWPEAVKALQHKVLHHLEEEEEKIFPLARQVLSEQESAALGADYGGEFAEQREKVD
ncbi:MAG: hemerythrin domain-containing protein [Pseudomonadota bacterium]